MNYRQRVGNNKHTVDGFRAYASYGLIHSDDHSRFNTKRQIEGAHTYEQTSEKGAFFFSLILFVFILFFLLTAANKKKSTTKKSEFPDASPFTHAPFSLCI